MQRGTLILEDDCKFDGFVFGASTNVTGEVGIPDEKAIDDFGIQRWVESNKIYASGLIVSTCTEQYSHWNAVESLSSWLNKHNVPGIDTCMLTKKLREHGTMIGKNYSVKQDEFDGLFLSSGPGNPQTQCRDTIATIKSWIDSETIKPVFGISLGHQLMALAAGMKITKLKYENRGYNQACLLEGTQRCFITSQNHGFAVEKVRFLPSG
ncbi:unnamed protein product [Rotaria sordida]|uniref:Carbamoyl-phosphate synthase small subunit N-terminal domain-containing protein n=1 Tax=Rotaria sordida TaxID=392033 RepID=A0A815TMW7_9BILA|nr:unnamed protein product [Rotaria sordida]CAF4127527.1 unnamed protein product [Rotaria sordida]